MNEPLRPNLSPQNEEEAMENAQRAGWDPEDGPPPYEHGTFVDGVEAIFAPDPAAVDVEVPPMEGEETT